MTLQLNRKKSTSGIPLDDISVSLYESYLRSHWYHDQSGSSAPSSPVQGNPSPLGKKSTANGPKRPFLPLYLYAALLRAAILPWTEAPQTVSDTFLDRLMSAEALSSVFSIAPDEHKLALARALAANNQLGQELQLQINSISDGVFPGVSSSDDGLSTEAYSEWSKLALKDVQVLLQRHARLPEFNGAMSLTIVKADQIEPVGKKSFRLKESSDLCPYVVVDLKDYLGNKVEKMTTSVQPVTSSPHWKTSFSPQPLVSEGCEVLMKVKHCAKGNEPLPGRDKTLSYTGVKLTSGGLHSGMPMTISIPLYGPAAPKTSAGGFCGCFGGGSVVEMEEGDLAPPNTPGGKVSGGVKHVIFDPSINTFEGSLQGLREQGSIELTLVYYYETRVRDKRVENPLNDGRALEGAGSMPRRGEEVEELNSTLKKSKSRGRGRSDAGGPSPSFRVMSIQGLTYKQYLQSILVQPLEVPSSISHSNVSMTPAINVSSSHCYDADADVNPHSMFRTLASSLFAAHRSGSLSRLEPFYAQYHSPDSSPRGGRSEAASPGQPSQTIDPTVLASILAIAPPKAVCELLEDPRAKLPFGWGLPLLIQFAKLYRIRPETQRLVLLQYMLLHYDPVKLDTMLFFRSAWEPCLYANINGSLTSDEVHGLRAVMSLFLTKAVPALNNHYAMYSHSEGVEAFSLLIEMVGWSLTWNPEAEPPISSLHETLTRAVKNRLISDFKVGGNSLPESIQSAAEEVKLATVDLRRDILIQEELPGLEGFLKSNAYLRYNIITDHLEMLVAYQPGGSTASMNLFFKLEEELNAHHELLIKHGLASLPDYAVNEDQEDDIDLISLWDIESPMIAALEQWIRSGGVELGQRCPRVLEAEKWTPISGSQRMGHSSVELLRLVNTSLESWVRSALGGGLRRREAVGAVIISCLTDLLSFYAREFVRFWEPMLSSRSFLSAVPGAPGQRLTAAVLFSAGPFEPNSFPSVMNLASAQKPHRESLTGKAPEVPPSPSLRMRTHHRAATSFGDGMGSMGNLDALGDALEAFGVTGVTLTEQMCTLTATLIQLIEDCKSLGQGLAEAFSSDRKLLEGSHARYGPEWLHGPWTSLINELETILSSITTSYSIHFRETLIKIFITAFGNRPGSEISVKSLEGILSTIYDELGCMMRGTGATKNSKLPSTSRKTLMDLSDAAWRGAIGAIQQLALNQAQGFRPLSKVEAEWARDFLDSLLHLFEEELPEGFSPHRRSKDYDKGLSFDLVSLRSSSHAYCSALLQALSSDTSDLQDLYEAQFSCLQQARSAVEGCVFIELGTSQVSLLDLLRLMRQRRKVDVDSAQFVVEQLKKAEPIVTQVVFGMTGNERLLAEFPCFLVPSSEPVSQRLVPQSSFSHHHRTSSFGATQLTAAGGTPVGRGFGTVHSSVQGRLYLTQSTLSFTTLFDFDLKGTTDQTMVVLKSNIASTQSPSFKSLVIKTKDLETYCFSGFNPGDRERLQGLLSHNTGGAVMLRPRHTRHASVDDKEKTSAPPGPLKAETSASRFVQSTPARRLQDSSPARQPHEAEENMVTPPPESGYSELVQSVPCYLYGAIRNRDGVLHLYSDRVEFASSQQQQVLHSVLLRDIEHIGQRQINSSMLGIGSGMSSLMSFQVAGLPEPLLFGGIGTDALMFHLKQTISELCFSAG